MDPEEPIVEVKYNQDLDRRVLTEVIREFIWIYAPSNWTLEMAILAKQKIENILLSHDDVTFKREIGI